MAIGTCAGMDFRRGYASGTDDTFTICGTVLGAGMGSGYGSALLASGTHPYNAQLKLIKMN